MVKEGQNACDNATAIKAKTVNLTDCSINVHAGGFAKIFSSISSISIGMGILAFACALIFAYWTSTNHGIDNKMFSTIHAADQSTDKDNRQDRMPLLSKLSDIEVNKFQHARPSWEAVTRVLTAVEPFVPETVEYGEERFFCTARSPRMRRFRGRCVDLKTRTVSICVGHSDPTTAVRNAAAQLIREMITLKKYLKPYDARDMPTKCNTPPAPHGRSRRLDWEA